MHSRETPRMMPHTASALLVYSDALDAAPGGPHRVGRGVDSCAITSVPWPWARDSHLLASSRFSFSHRAVRPASPLAVLRRLAVRLRGFRHVAALRELRRRLCLADGRDVSPVGRGETRLLLARPVRVAGPPVHRNTWHSSFSQSRLRHVEGGVAMETARSGLDEGSFVVEVASNGGHLLRDFVKRDVSCRGIEPVGRSEGFAVRSNGEDHGPTRAHRVWRRTLHRARLGATDRCDGAC